MSLRSALTHTPPASPHLIQQVVVREPVGVVEVVAVAQRALVSLWKRGGLQRLKGALEFLGGVG